jgi:hypothetical protein
MCRSYTTVSVWPIQFETPFAKGFKDSESDVVAALPLRSVLRHEELEQFRMTHGARSASKPRTERLYREGGVGGIGTESLRCLLI